MSDLTCACGQPVHDNAVICERCVARLTQNLAEIPAVVSQVEETLTRQDRISHGTGKPQDAHRYCTNPQCGQEVTKVHCSHHEHDGMTFWWPLADVAKVPQTAAITGSVLHLGASQALKHLHGVLVAWVRCLHELVPDDPWPTDDTPALSRWLLTRMHHIEHHEAATEIADEIGDAIIHARRTTDSPPEEEYAGPCGADDDACTQGLYAPRGATSTVCPACGTEWDIAKHREELTVKAQDRLVGALDLSRALTFLGRPLSTRTILRWAEKGRLRRRDTVNGRPMYRVGDAITLRDEDTKRASGEVA